MHQTRSSVPSVSSSSEIDLKQEDSKYEPILIPIFTQKGGVGKTTSTFNIGCLLAKEYGMKVLMVDADPQCNLTAISSKRYFIEKENKNGRDAKIDEENDELILSNALEKFYKGDEHFFLPNREEPKLAKERGEKQDSLPINNLYRALQIIRRDLETKGVINSVEEIVARTELISLKKLDDTENLFLLPSSMELYIADNELTVLVGGEAISKNFVFCPSKYIRALAKKNGFDVVLIDLSPNIGGLNQGLLLLSDYFMMPGEPGFFTNQAVAAIARALPRWIESYASIAQKQRYGDIAFSKFLTFYIQKVPPRPNGTTKAAQKWIQKIEKTVCEKLLPVLKNASMVVEGKNYKITPTVTLFTNNLLSDTQIRGFPIACLTSYSEYTIQEGHKKNLNSYKNQYSEVLKQGMIPIAEKDGRIKNKFKKRFLLTTEDIHARINEYIEDAKIGDFSTVISQDFAQDARTVKSDLYPQSITIMLRFINNLKQKYPKVYITFPYAYPESELSEELENSIKNHICEIEKNSIIEMCIIPFYYKLNWIILIIDYTADNIDRFITPCDLQREERDVAEELYHLFREENEEIEPSKEDEHPINIIKKYLRKYDRKPSTKQKPGRPRKSGEGTSRWRGPTIREQLLGKKVNVEYIKNFVKDDKQQKNLHYKYINDLVRKLNDFFQQRNVYQDVLNLLKINLPQLAYEDFPLSTKIISLYSILSTCEKLRNIDKANEINVQLIIFLRTLFKKPGNSSADRNLSSKISSSSNYRFHASNIGEPVHTYPPVLLDEEFKTFTEYKVSGDRDNCGFTVLGVSRPDAVVILHQLAHEPWARSKIFDELKEAEKLFRLDEKSEINPTLFMPPSVRDLFHSLYTQLIIRENALEILINKVHDFLRESKCPPLPDGNSQENILTALLAGEVPGIENKTIDEVKTAKKAVDDKRVEICNNKEIIQAYISSYNQDGGGLRLGAGAMYCIARHKGLGFKLFWGGDPKDENRTLRLNSEFSLDPGGLGHVIYVVLQPGHYNFLAEAEASQQQSIVRSESPLSYEQVSTVTVFSPKRRKIEDRSSDESEDEERKIQLSK